MTIQGSILIAVVATALGLWMLSLVRRGRLWVGYAVVCLVGFALVVLLACVAPLRHVAEETLEYFFPRAGLAVGLGMLGAVALIYVLSQLTIISNRLVRAVQKVAVREALREAGTPSGDTAGGETLRAEPASTPRTVQTGTR